MNKVLYITNIMVPYRAVFFNELSKYCELTVLYERRKSTNRDNKWANSERVSYIVEYLDGCNIGNEYSFSLRIIDWIKRGWDCIIIGCYNSKVQMLAIMAMRLMGIRYCLNLDGEIFIGKGIKARIKKFFLKGADHYFIAGERAAENLREALKCSACEITSYKFSSLHSNEIAENCKNDNAREKYVLVVGQYFNYKGMDIAYQVALKNIKIKYRFVGMGGRTDLFLKNNNPLSENVEIVPFLQHKDLFEEYKHCKLLLLPTRQECWGLVVNEAASCGTPIVSTTGSGAAVEFLTDQYSCYLAEPGNVDSLFESVMRCYESENNDEFSEYLKEKSKEYSIEKMVENHIKFINKY